MSILDISIEEDPQKEQQKIRFYLASGPTYQVTVYEATNEPQ